MAHTPRAELERLPSFAEQIGALPRDGWTRCDSCLQPIDPKLEGPTRYRHTDCPTPPLPQTARDVLARVRSRAPHPASGAT